MLEISWTAWLELRYWRPTKWEESVEVGTGVELANEPPMTLSVGFREKSCRINFSSILCVPYIVDLVGVL